MTKSIDISDAKGKVAGESYFPLDCMPNDPTANVIENAISLLSIAS